MFEFFKRAALFLIPCLLLTFAGSGCSGRSGRTVGAGAEGRAVIEAVVTFDALYELAAAVGGDRVRVTNIMPPGAEAHHFEPGARDLATLNTADVFLICGLGFDPWARNAADAAGNIDLSVFEVSDGVGLIMIGEAHDGHDGDGYDGDEHRSDSDHDHDGGHDGDGGGVDPHIWLSPVCAAQMADNIAAAFSEADPDGAAYYRGNCDELKERLNGLFDEYSEKFAALANRTIVTGHAVFMYLCRDFGLTQNSIEGVFAEGEPSARELARLVDFCRAGSITAILAERLSSPLVAETLASEAGARVMTIYTMESAEDGLSFLERMERNLAAVYAALQ